MPLPLTVSCFSKIQIGFTLLVPAHPGTPGQRAVKRVCVCCNCQTNKVSLLTDAAVVGCKPTVPRGYFVGGEDIRGKGVTCVLQIIVETLVHLVVAPIKAIMCAHGNKTTCAK